MKKIKKLTMNLKMWANFLFWRHGVGCSFLASCTLLSVCHLPLKLLHQCISPSYSIHSTYTRHQTHNIHIMLQCKTSLLPEPYMHRHLFSVNKSALFIRSIQLQKMPKAKKDSSIPTSGSTCCFKAIALYTPFLYVDLIQELT